MAGPVQADGWDVYGTLGYGLKSKAGNVRIGVMKDHFGGEVCFQSDLNRLGRSLEKMDGKTYRLSLMGGFSYRPFSMLMLTVNAGYGATGTYMVDATQTSYGAVDLKKGFEAGLTLNYIMADYIMLYGGMSFYPIGKEGRTSEILVGVGLMF